MKPAILSLLLFAAAAEANMVLMPQVETNYTGKLANTPSLTLQMNSGQSIALPAPPPAVNTEKFVGKRVTVTVVTERTTGTNTVIRHIRKIEEAPQQPNAKP